MMANIFQLGLASVLTLGLISGLSGTSLADSSRIALHSTVTAGYGNPNSVTRNVLLSYSLRSQSDMIYKPGSRAVAPLTTVKGPGGIARLNVLSSEKELAWNVTPYNMETSWFFTGTITIYVLDPYTREYVYNNTIDVSGSGNPGDSTGNTFSIANYPTGLSYTAALNGTATDLFGDTDTVLPSCVVAWYFPR